MSSCLSVDEMANELVSDLKLCLNDVVSNYLPSLEEYFETAIEQTNPDGGIEDQYRSVVIFQLFFFHIFLCQISLYIYLYTCDGSDMSTFIDHMHLLNCVLISVKCWICMFPYNHCNRC